VVRRQPLLHREGPRIKIKIKIKKGFGR